ncbi:MAG: hypothetical protein KBA81_02705 [Rhabdochlamydiaceae bacterium]|nr:hypothetical protein [Rhabdochlamydiaceae bacterium]
MSKEDFLSKSSSSLAQKVVSLVSIVAYGVLALGSKIPYRIKPGSCVGLVSGAVFFPTTALAQMPAVGEFRVNTNTTRFVSTTTTYGFHSLSDPKLAGFPDGSFAVVWAGYGLDGSANGIYCQRYNSLGFPVESEFRANTYTSNNQDNPAIAVLMDGSSIFAWESSNQDGSGGGIYGQGYDALWVPAGTESRMNTNTTGDQQLPTLAVLSGGGYVVVWQGDQTGNFDIYCQQYNASRVPVGPEFRVNTNTTGTQSTPKVIGLIGGGFVIVWVGNQAGNLDVYGQIYDALGVPLGSEFLINNITTNDQENPIVESLLSEGFVVAWQGRQTGSSEIYGRVYDIFGATVKPEFRLNTVITNLQARPALARLKNGGFVAAWEGEQNGNPDIYGQRYNVSLVTVGSEFRVNTNTANNQENPTVAALDDGGFVIAWESGKNESMYPDIYGQRYDASGAPIVNFSTPTIASSTLTSSLASTTMLTSSSMSQGSSAAQPSSLTQSSLTNGPSSLSSSLVPSSTVPSTMAFGSSSQTSVTYLSITTISYETTYSITLDGLDVGTFVFHGGTGLIDGTLSNTITLNIDPDLAGETFTLFTIPAGQEGEFQTIELVGASCQSFESQIVQDGMLQTFQAILQGTTCSTAMRSQGVFLKV